jgi:hypothetical protein
VIAVTGYNPRPWQERTHAAMAEKRFSVLVVHRRAGKTVLAVNALIDAALRCGRVDGRFVYLAPLLKQARATAWAILKQYARVIKGIEFRESLHEARFENNATITLYGADNPDAMRGQYFDGIVLDEVAQMKPEVWGEIIRPALTDRQGWALFIGTPKGINLFSQLYYAALDDPTWHAELLRYDQTDALPESEVELARATMTEAQFDQEFRSNFSAGAPDVLFTLDEVLAASRRHYREDQFCFAAKVLGVDIARQGDDRSSAVIRQGLVSFEPAVWRIPDLMVIADRLAHIIAREKPQAVFIDTGGLGVGVYDRLRQLGFSVTQVDFGSRPTRPEFEDKRSEMWAEMAVWVRGGGAIFPHPDLISDLTVPKFDPYSGASGKFQLERKDEIKARLLRSPDVGDALALTFAAPVAAPALVGAGLGPRQPPMVMQSYPANLLE